MRKPIEDTRQGKSRTEMMVDGLISAILEMLFGRRFF